MGCLGVHFALHPDDLRRVLASVGDDEALLALIHEDIEERNLETEREWQFQTDKAWDALHRCLTNGLLEYESGPFPISYAVLGGRQLYGGDDFIASLVDPPLVAPTASALKAVTKDWLHSRYLTIDPDEYGLNFGDDDFEYTWENFQGLPEFFERAAEVHRAVVFTADQ